MQEEGIGGPCPLCESNSCFMKKGSGTWYTFIACAECRFAYGENADNRLEETNGVVTGADVWDSVMKAFKPDDYDDLMSQATEKSEYIMESPFDFSDVEERDLLEWTISESTAKTLYKGSHPEYEITY